MKYAEVAVNTPRCHSTFCYAIPPQLDLDIGQAVWVPFGPRVVQAIIIKLSDLPSFEETKEISSAITAHPLLSPIQIELAQWISQHYLSPPFDAIALMLPPGFERQTATYFQPGTSERDLSSLNSEQIQILRLVEKRGGVSLKEIQRKFGINKTKRITDQLLHRHLITKSQELQETKVKPKTTLQVKLAAREDEVDSGLARLNKSRAYKQAELLEFLAEQTQPVPVSEIKKRLNCSLTTITALESRHLISTELVKVRRDPLSHLTLTHAPAPALTSSQQAAWKSIQDAIATSPSPEHNEGEAKQSQPPPVFLLFGVTGSGKTEVYLRALAQVVSMGKRGICLIPEIALTTQTVERFANRFPGRVAVLHSGLSLGEQFDEWEWIQKGNCDVVVGPRSALFAPQPNLGLIIMDEEHEWTYKQEDKSPRYHARDVALKLAQLSGAAVILGSATPDIESFHKAQLGQYQLVELKERITPQGYSPLPQVSIVDMKEELKAGHTGLFSRSLLAGIKRALEQNEQTILFLNRRGTATFVRCSNCGFVFRCPRCSVALTYHSVEKKLTCHRCHYSTPVPQTCPQCPSQRLRFSGIGTQRVEDEVRHLFPKARLLRWDKDVVTKRRAHEELLQIFRDHRADILIGTQMIAKGLDLPQVTLAGIISADTGLNFPDFRAGERTFQLLCQVAGRAGRGVKAGNVIIQTYSPENYAIQAASRHDYVRFYDQEIDYRRQFNYPPFSRFIRLVYTHTNNDLCHREAERIGTLILREKESKGIADLSLIGPVPAFASRVRGRYRWQIILRGSDPAQALSEITLPQGWTVDVDPVGVV
jgi:primosomal protein N' (replication factor Y)